MSEWNGKTVIITGGSGGMGRAAAKKFLAEGAYVLIADINQDRMNQTIHDLSKLPGIISAIYTDVSKISDCEATIKQAIENTGRLDALINTAGVWVEGMSADMTEEMWNHTIDINLKGTFFMCRYAIPELAKTCGCIVNISSDAGLVGNACAAIYCASKGGVTIMTKALAIELAPLGIRANVLCPGDVDTPMIQYQAEQYGNGDPEGYIKNLLANYPQQDRARFTRADEIAESIYFLASPKVQAITGATLSIDFGITAGY